MLVILEWRFFLLDLKRVYFHEYIYLIENFSEQSVTSRAVFKHDTPTEHICTVLLTVTLAALKKKLLAWLVAAPNLTFTNHTELKELRC